MQKGTTLRLLFPQWQGGVNYDYAFGAELLAAILPPNSQDALVKVCLEDDTIDELVMENGIVGERVLLKQLQQVQTILQSQQPEKVIVIGGDCSVSLGPFDYLKETYQEKLGILWLDAHPDVAELKNSTHAHEMVLANLLGKGSKNLLKQTGHFFAPSEVMLGGLVEESLRPMDQLVKKMSLRFATPETLAENSSPILEWLEAEKIEKLAIHFDLDVLSPEDFRSIYPAEPYLKSFDAAIGKMTLSQIGRILTDVSELSEIVGLSITERLPWDAIRLRKTLEKVSIFKK